MIDELICVDGLLVSYLCPGIKFSLKTWRIHRSKKKENFIENGKE